jgi:hypothetical protein
MEEFEALVGEWVTEVQLGGQAIRGRSTFEWLDGGGYLIQRTTTEDQRFPRAVMVTGPTFDGSRVVQHYFDSRGVARVYEVSLEDGVWLLSRDDPDDFAQQFSGRFSADGTRIDGAWRRTDGGEWRHDFDLTYTKLA